METMTAIEALKKIESNEPNAEMRDATALRVGEGVRQGDVYLARVATIKVKGTKGAQLVDGTTRGSRHVLEGDFQTFEAKHDAFPSWVDRDSVLPALAFRVGEGGARLTHPEHAHVLFAPNTTWVTWQQMDARTLRRVQD